MRATFVVLALAAAATAAPSQKAPPKGRFFDKFLMIMMENTNYTTALQDPNFKAIADNGCLLSNYYAVTHPSAPNYVATVDGNNVDINNTLIQDDAHRDVAGKGLVGSLEAGQISWKAYMENYPGDCYNGNNFPIGGRLYARKHNPFIMYPQIRANPTLCAKIVNETVYADDLKHNILPQYSYYVPNQNNDAHDTNTTFSGKWLNTCVNNLLDSPANKENLAVLIVFDENDDFTNHDVSQVYAVLTGSAVEHCPKPDDTLYSHYSIIKTVVENWKLQELGKNDVLATAFKPFKSLGWW
ncbi:hypothetical protein HDV00_010361 [Rhizophlyctis rosea]|nr:hypothetical protein HDV00_010361 [Rhizophlyctis rosea]